MTDDIEGDDREDDYLEDFLRRQSKLLHGLVNPAWARQMRGLEGAVSVADDFQDRLGMRQIEQLTSEHRKVFEGVTDRLGGRELGAAPITKLNGALSATVGMRQLEAIHPKTFLKDEWGVDTRSVAATAQLRGLDDRYGFGTLERVLRPAAEALDFANALRVAADIAPWTSLRDREIAFDRVRVSVIGKAALKVAAMFPAERQIASETLGLLTKLELPSEREGDDADSSPLGSSVAHLRSAVHSARTVEELLERLVSATEVIYVEVARRSGFDGKRVAGFVFHLILTLLVPIAISLRAEMRGDREEKAAIEERKKTDADRSKADADRKKADDDSAEVRRLLSEVVHHLTLLSQAGDPTTSSAGRPVFAVEHAVVLREANDNRSKRVTTLYPGYTVELVNQVGRSLKVVYFDHARGIQRTGWVRKKYLRRLAQ